jgi:hemerythrin-like domain-containing protein
MTNQKIANVVVAVLNQIELDGEIMEHIIDEVGMRDQMIKQLITNKEEPTENAVVASFTRNRLIEYTREIQERYKRGAIEAVNNAGMDFEDMVTLELDYNNQISIEFDESTLHHEIGNVIDEAFETDDDSIFDEAINVISNMSGPK